MLPSLRTKKFEATHWLIAVSLCALSAQGQAQTIYRCGNDYSATANCEQPTAVQGSTAATPSASTERRMQTQTQALQKQADGLEKQRLQNERTTAGITTPPLGPQELHNSPKIDKGEAQPNNAHSHKKHGKASSPYFTARGDAPAKAAKKSGGSP